MRISKKTGITVVVAIFVLGAAAYGALVLQRDRIRALDDGIVAFKKGEYAEAIERLSPLAEQGNATAQDTLGIIYAYGLSVPKDKARAQELFLAADNAIVAERFFYIAQRFDLGDEVGKDSQEALAWYIAAAEHGHKQAQSVLMQAYRNGHYGLTSDQRKSEYWSQKMKGR